jgi:hypothetical protein
MKRSKVTSKIPVSKNNQARKKRFKEKVTGMACGKGCKKRTLH